MPLLLPNPFCNLPGAGALPSLVLPKDWSPSSAASGSPQPQPHCTQGMPPPTPTPWATAALPAWLGCSCCPPRPWRMPPAWAFLWGSAISNLKAGKARGVTPSLAMKWQAHKAHRGLAAHSSHVDLTPDLGALDDLLVPLWLQAHRAVAPGTSSAQHTKLLLAQADTGNYGVTPPAQSREFL